jgi:hypothetical protein
MKRAAFHYGEIALIDFDCYLKELYDMAAKTINTYSKIILT